MGFKWLVLLVLLVTSTIHSAPAKPAATGEVKICSKGAGLGNCTKPQGIAADTETGAVYVAGRDPGRLERIMPRGGAR